MNITDNHQIAEKNALDRARMARRIENRVRPRSRLRELTRSRTNPYEHTQLKIQGMGLLGRF